MGAQEVEAYLLHVKMGEAVEDCDGVIDELSGHPTFWLQDPQILTPPEGVSQRQVRRVQSFTPGSQPRSNAHNTSMHLNKAYKRAWAPESQAIAGGKVSAAAHADQVS